MEKITLVSGFGSKHWETAIYLDGKLLADGWSGSLEDSEQAPMKALVEALAKELGASIEERCAPVSFRSSFYAKAPERLEDLDRLAAEYFASENFDSWSERCCWEYLSTEKQEERVLHAIYECSGGDAEHFEKWLAQFREAECGGATFLSANFERYALMDAARRAGEAKKEMADKLGASILEDWEKLARKAWDTPKPLCAGALLAKGCA